MFNKSFVACIGLFFVSGAFGNIVVWTNNAQYCEISDVNNTIQINAAGTYGFRGETGGVLNEIAEITLGANVTGTVTVTIAYDANGGVGATNVEQIILGKDNDNILGVIAGITISGNLATEGNVSCDSITGPVTVGGTLDDDVDNGHLLAATSVTGAITLTGGLIGHINVGTLGDITIGDAPGICDGNITIANEYTGAFNMTEAFRGDLVLHNNLAGSIHITGTYYGHIVVDGDLVAPNGAITLTGNIIPNRGLPAIRIHGSITGSGAPNPVIRQLGGTPGGVNAVIAIDGSLADACGDTENPVPEIQTNRGFGASGAVAIHYDGQQTGETWAETARVKIQNTEYGENTPAAQVWRVTATKGDMDNDGRGGTVESRVILTCATALEQCL
jgi:hypothetical protein